MATYTEEQADVHYVRACACDNFLPSLKELPEKANKMFPSSKLRAIDSSSNSREFLPDMADENCEG